MPLLPFHSFLLSTDLPLPPCSHLPALPIRPSSPLPPNVPTGPRNKLKYKDIDGSAPAVDGLDYGGGGKEVSRHTPDDDRSAR